MSEPQFIRLLGLLYRSAESPAFWLPFLQALQETFRSHVANFYSQDLPTGSAHISASTAPTEANDLYVRHYSQLHPYYRKLVECPTMQPGLVVTDHTAMPTSELRKTEFFVDFLNRFDCHRALQMTPFREGNLLGNLAVLRSDSVGPYTEAEVRLMLELVPHIRRALRISKRMELLGALDCTVARLNFGVVAVDTAGRCIHTNQAADQLLALKDGIVLSDGFLSVAENVSERKLKALISSAVHITAIAGQMLIQRPSGKRPFWLLVAPSRDYPLADSGFVAGVVFLADTELQAALSSKLLYTLYDLTPAEAHVAIGIAQGKRMGGLCTELQVSFSTIRTHLNSIYQKTNTNSQADLTRLLVTGPVGSLEEQI